MYGTYKFKLKGTKIDIIRTENDIKDWDIIENMPEAWN